MIEVGVYRIDCAANGRVYVGSSVNLKKRWQKHLRELRDGSHYNSKLLRAWSKHGEAAFTFNVIELAPKDQLLKREQHWLDALNVVDDGFNLSRIAGAPGGRLGRPHTEETKAKIRAKRALQVMQPEAMARTHAAVRGTPRPQAVRDRISATHTGKKLSPEHCESIRRARLDYIARNRLEQAP